MYIKSVTLSNIRAVRQLRLSFPKSAGWHVLLGENGAGKSSILRAISLVLIGPNEILRLDPDFSTWVSQGEESAFISVECMAEYPADKLNLKKIFIKNSDFSKMNILKKPKINAYVAIAKADTGWYLTGGYPTIGKTRPEESPEYTLWGNGKGWFSAAFGPYRRFTGGDTALESFYQKNARVAAHLTAFNDSAALTEAVVWFKDLLLRSLSAPASDAGYILQSVITFLNQGELLPPGYTLEKMTADGPVFLTPMGARVQLYELSEGLKSVTSIVMELLRLLLRTYSTEQVFPREGENRRVIPVPGVVLIDEVDVHLHPTWQSRIGKWFTTYFPHIQFIVTTHSAFACRGATSIWQLPVPNGTGEQQAHQLTKDQLQRLLYGDILDAYGTGFFGDVTRDLSANNDLERLATLNLRFYRDELTAPEATERETLLTRFPEHGTLLAS